MSSEKDAFEDRLRRIRDSRAETSPPIGAGHGRMPPNEPRSSSKTTWVIGYLVFGLVCAGGVTLVAAKVSDGPRALWQNVQANLQGADVASAEPGFVDRLVSVVFPSGDDTPHSPTDVLPQPPEGWVRVTPADAELPNALDPINAQLSQIGGPVPLEKNPGYEQLVQFLNLSHTSDKEGKAGSKLHSVAIYLNGEGEFLNVRLQFEPESTPLGGQNDPASWIEGLAAIEEKSLGIGEILERLTLAGIDVTNQTKAAGTSLVRRPIGSDIYAQTAMKIAVPLTSRAILRLHGLATPVVAQALIAGVDRDDLSARLE